MVLTHRYRVKDATAGTRLARMAVAVNRVWNYAGGVQNDSRRHNKRRPSFPELARLTAGGGKELGLHSDTVQDVLKHWVEARDEAGRRPIKWRGGDYLGVLTPTVAVGGDGNGGDISVTADNGGAGSEIERAGNADRPGNA